MNSSQLGRTAAILLITIRISWDFTGDIVRGNSAAVVLDTVLIISCVAVALLLYSDVAALDALIKERTVWKSRAVQAEANLLHLGRAVTERLNARAAKPEIDHDWE